jgi:hypothetical protein
MDPNAASKSFDFSRRSWAIGAPGRDAESGRCQFRTGLVDNPAGALPAPAVPTMRKRCRITVLGSSLLSPREPKAA